ncbi:MAG TPA: tetratricopeptide repeat protein [Thermoanaerobaculia bacterium]|jgi:tetratricopeptide (TPR) repeat protein|nr:tetratricopeptide repeat protein [Thermoanaerobaculia bacterium]
MKILAILLVLAQPRLASDFEIAQMELQLARSRTFEAQLSGRLNLGDLRAARTEASLARDEYRKALDLAERERLAARRDSSLSRYANATSYAALAQAKLGRAAEAFTLLEETARYASDDPESWNLYASAMRTLGHPRKAVSAARNAVALATTKPLDRAVYQHALATALIEADELGEAEKLLVTVTDSLRSRTFESLQRDVARQESFEVYSSARGDVAAYVSLLNRAQLRLASLYEKRGRPDLARTQYTRVLQGRSDDVTALAALARLATSDAERERYYAEAFDANPFSLPLVRAYQDHLRTQRPPNIDDTNTGAQMRLALAQIARGETRAARATLDALLVKFPQNDTLRALRREAEGATSIALPSSNPTSSQLQALLDGFERLTPEQFVTLDQTTFTSIVAFRGTVFEAGMIDGVVAFRFSEPTVFQGTFDITQPLRLTYRILGVTRDGDRDALLLEPVRLEGLQ